jgi:Tfp pilus assembly protein PilO
MDKLPWPSAERIFEAIILGIIVFVLVYKFVLPSIRKN